MSATLSAEARSGTRRRPLLMVGDGPTGVATLQKLASHIEKEWETTFASSVPEAQDLIQKASFEVAVVELRIGGISGVQLLDHLTEKHPQTQRFVLADLTDKQAVTRCVGSSHHYLPSPCDPATLRTALDRASSLDAWLMNDHLKRFIAQMQKLPSIPSLYFQVVRELQSPTASLDTIGNLIARDQVMTAKLLQLINSAVFGLRRQISNPTEAVLCLGVETTKSVLLLAHTFSYFDRIKSPSFSVDTLWEHALSVGSMSRHIAQAHGASSNQVEESFTAGLLHDIGKLVIACNLPQDYLKVIHEARRQKQPFHVQEMEKFALTHAEVGACVLGIWGLPVPIIEAVALHHCPALWLNRDKEFSPLTAVHTANVWEQEQRFRNRPDRPSISALDKIYLQEIGVAEELEQWRIVCNLPPMKEEDATTTKPTPDTSAITKSIAA